MSIKGEIKKKVEYILNTDEDEANLNRLNEQLASYEKKLEESAWERTPENVKREIRVAFDSLKRPENRISEVEMDKFLDSWKERLSSQQ